MKRYVQKLPDSPQHSNNAAIPGDVQLPLYYFFISLKQNGFLVTPAQIADSNLVISQYATSIANEAALCDYLSPLFANSEEEQVKFRELFYEHFIQPQTVSPPPNDKWKILKDYFNKHWWKYTALIAILIAVWIKFRPNKETGKPDGIYLRSNTEGVYKEYNGDFNGITGQPLHIYPKTEDATRDSIYKISLAATYHWGDGTSGDTSGIHSYNKEGIYAIKAFIKVYYNKRLHYLDTISALARICNERSDLLIQHSIPTDSVRVGERIRLTASIKGSQPTAIQWMDGAELIGTGSKLDTVYSTQMNKQLTCVAVYDSVGSPCTISKYIYLVVYDPDKPVITASFAPSTGAKEIVLAHKVKSWWFWLMALLLAGSFVGIYLLEKFKRKKKAAVVKDKEETEKKYTELVSSFAGKKPPFDLPFRSKNSLPLPEPALNEVAWQMRRRIDDEATYLHLPRTIQASIERGGFFKPVKVPRTHQSEYLVLIDETIVNNQQVKLFEYLIELLRKQNVFADKFYYRQEPNWCYNVFEPAGISLEKLYEKFPRHVLLIFGNAHQLIYPHYPIFDPGYLKLIRRWKHKAIITPATVPDWSIKEKKVLADAIPVLPADVFGQFLLMQKIFNGEAVETTDFNEFSNQFYKTTHLDFEEVEDITTYCEGAAWAKLPGESENNILFQWIAALAIYPRIRWELIIAIGKAILEKYGKPEELNFTNLLKIARIQWMREGRFPDYTRMELLKKLLVENEVVARKEILVMLKEIPEDEITADQFVYEEKEIQRIINEFTLFAYDPSAYPAYEPSKWLFEKLWKDKKILDAPAKTYLKNAGAEWETLINKQSEDGTTQGKKTIPVEAYFEQEAGNTSTLKDWRVWFGVVLSLVLLGSLIGLILLTILNFLNTNKFAAFTYKKPEAKNISFILKDSTGTQTSGVVTATVDSIDFSLMKDSINQQTLWMDDSIKDVIIASDGEEIYRGRHTINYDAYTVTLKTPVVTNSIKVTLYLSNACKAGLAGYVADINSTGKNIVVTDTIVANGASAGTGCFNQLSFGRRVDTLLIVNIINIFAAKGISIRIAPPSGTSVLAENEVAIYYAAAPPDTTIKLVPVLKAGISITISDESLRPAANAFRKTLLAKGFKVQDVNIISYQSNSSIGYFNPSLKGEVEAIRKMYNTYFPRLNIPVELITNTRMPSSSNQVSIYIRKLETQSLPLKAGDTGSKVLELQAMLQEGGFKVAQTSTFDKTTQDAVIEFQLSNKLVADGIVGQQVWSALENYVSSRATQQSSAANSNVQQQQPQTQQQQAVTYATKQIIDIAIGEIGNQENPTNKTKYGEWYGLNNEPWSAIFISWVYDQAGKPLNIETTKGFASFRNALNYFNSNNMITNNPEPGDIVITVASNSGNMSGGIFSKWIVQGKSFEWIMGNSNTIGTSSGGSVTRRTSIYNEKLTYFARPGAIPKTR